MMQYRMLGNTGLRVSEIGFGCGNVGGLMVRGSHDQQISSVRHALDLGINYFDTARAYGEGQSETNLGRVLDEIGEEVILSTKIRLESDALQDIAAATASEVEQGLARLGRGSVDLIQLHTRLVEKREPGRFAMTPDEVLGPGGVIEAFKRLRDQGRVGFFGFTGLGDVEAIHALVDSGEFHSFQAYYNLLNPSAGRPCPRASALWTTAESSTAPLPAAWGSWSSGCWPPGCSARFRNRAAAAAVNRFPPDPTTSATWPEPTSCPFSRTTGWNRCHRRPSASPS